MTTSEMTLKVVNNKRETSNLLLFSMGKLVSIFGASIYTFAIGLYVLNITKSGLSFATTLILGTIPAVLLNPIAGVVADRFNKKTIVVAGDLLNGAFLIILYFVSSIYGLKLIMICTSTFIMTVINTFFGISIEAAKPNIVSEKKLMNVNSISKVIDSVSTILGPMVGGVVFAFIDIRYFIIICGISFVLSGISEMFIDFKFNYKKEDETKEKVDFIKDIREGFKYMLERRNMVIMFGILIVLNFFFGFSITVPLPFILNNVLELGSTYFGIIQGAFPVGMIIGAVYVKSIMEKMPYEKLLLRMSIVSSICMILIGFPVIFMDAGFSEITYLLYYCVTVIILGIAISFIDIPIMYLLQSLVPDEYRGRVLSIGMSLAKIILPIALIASGILVNITPPYLMPITGGILLLLFNILLLKSGKTV